MLPDPDRVRRKETERERKVARRSTKKKPGAAVISKTMMLVLILCLLTVFTAGCGGGSSGSADDAKPAESAEAVDTAKAADKEDGFETPKFRKATFNKSKAEGNEEVQVDLSSVSSGYIALVCNSDARVKLQVIKDEDTYTYDVVMGKTQIFPLQCGNGSYTIKVMKNIEDNKYFELYKCEANVKLKDKLGPYLRPNQYADYTEKSECVKEAADLAKKAKSEQEFVQSVYDFVCKKIDYDKEKAETVQSGYIPEPDEILKSGKGICFDYSSLAASMLRSQGIPTKIIFGYVAPNDLYHAWNMFYTEETGWTKVEFKVSEKDWSRIDLTFSANGEDSKFIGDGKNYTDVYQY